MDLRSYVLLLLRRWPIALIAAVVLAGAGAALVLRAPAVYTATSSVEVQMSVGDDATMADRRLAQDYVLARNPTHVRAVTSTDVLDDAIDEVGVDMSVGALRGAVAASGVPSTSIISISVTDADPGVAAALANAVADAMPDGIAVIEGVTAGAEEQVDVRVAAYAGVPGSPSAPNIRVNLAVAIIVALFGGVVVAVVWDNFDTRIRRPRDVQRLHLPYLGGFAEVRGRVADELVRFEAASEDRRAALRRTAIDLLFAADRTPARIVVSSALPSAGKTTVAAGLAGALAEAGNRVVYLDTDARGGRLATLARIPQTRGITEVVAGKLRVDEVVTPWEAGGFSIVTIGSTSMSLGDMYASDAFGAMLDELEEHFEVIIVDAPPITNPSEAGRLSQHLQTVAVVARADETRRSDLVRVSTSLSQTGAELVGVVLNGVGDDADAATVNAELSDAVRR